MNFSESVKQQFVQRLSSARGAERGFRERAWAEYERLGLPDRGNEDWKYSSLSAVSARQWSDAVDTSAQIPDTVREWIQAHKVDFEIAVMMNGVFDKRASSLTLESGYEFETPRAPGEAFHFADGFVALAAAVNRGGYSLKVAPGVVYPKPLLIVHCVSGDGVWAPSMNRVQIGSGAQFNLCEVFLGASRSYLRTDLTLVDLSETAHFRWTRAQMENRSASHFSEVYVAQERNSSLHLTALNAGAEWARTTLTTRLCAEGAEASINGLTFAREDQHIEQRVQVRHLAAHTQSSQLFKGVLKDRARGVLNGKIHIAAGAQKVQSSHLNHNLLLSSQAEADTKPELEIFADDVKANHGATVGRLDEDKLFYLLSRGIPRAVAVNILARAFVSDVLMRMPSRTQRDWLSKQVESTLPEFAAQMEMK